MKYKGISFTIDHRQLYNKIESDDRTVCNRSISSELQKTIHESKKSTETAEKMLITFRVETFSFHFFALTLNVFTRKPRNCLKRESFLREN